MHGPTLPKADPVLAIPTPKPSTLKTSVITTAMFANQIQYSKDGKDGSNKNSRYDCNAHHTEIDDSDNG